MEDNFTEDQLQDIFFNMRRIEPAFYNWSDEKLKNLTKAIYKCGYSWTQQDKDVGFFHPTNELILNFKGLYFYTPESIIDKYNTVWSKESIETKNREERRVKSMKSLWLWIISFSSLFFVDRRYAVFIILPLFYRFLYYATKSGRN